MHDGALGQRDVVPLVPRQCPLVVVILEAAWSSGCGDIPREPADQLLPVPLPRLHAAQPTVSMYGSSTATITTPLGVILWQCLVRATSQSRGARG